jgi:hypothetical protein
MQRIVFGRIEGLAVRNGEPVLNPRPRIVRDIKLGSDSAPAPAKDDFQLKNQVTELLEHLEQLGTGTVECLEVRHGLPFRLTLEDRLKESC